jgi:hypothetical protein
VARHEINSVNLLLWMDCRKIYCVRGELTEQELLVFHAAQMPGHQRVKLPRLEKVELVVREPQIDPGKRPQANPAFSRG